MSVVSFKSFLFILFLVYMLIFSVFFYKKLNEKTSINKKVISLTEIESNTTTNQTSINHRSNKTHYFDYDYEMNEEEDLDHHKKIKQLSRMIDDSNHNKKRSKSLNNTEDNHEIALQLDNIVKFIYKRNVNDIDVILTFLNNLPKIEDTIAGYTSLFFLMLENLNDYNNVTFYLTFRVDQLLHHKNDQIILDEQSIENLNYIYMNCPNEFKFHNHRIRIVSTILNKSLITINGGNTIILANESNISDNHFRWTIQLVPGRTYYYFQDDNDVTNTPSQKYIIADVLDYNQSSEVILSDSIEKRFLGEWQLEINVETSLFRLKNIFFDKYLCTAYNRVYNQSVLIVCYTSDCQFDYCEWDFLK